MNGRRGFTVLETLLGFTIFALLIVLVVNFMSGTNMEIGTVTGQSIAHERCSIVLNYLATDVRGAKRGTILFPDRRPISAFTFMKYMDNKDDKASDKVVVQQITYRFEQSAARIVRYATAVRFTKDGKFEKDGPTAEQAFDHVSGFEVIPGSTDGSREHVNMLGFKVSSAVENRQLGHAQESTAQTIVYIRDENYFAKQPKWNENAMHTSSLVSLTFGKQNLPDFSEFTAAAKWIGDIATKFPAMVEDVGRQIFEETRQKLADRVHQETDRLKAEFLSSSSVDAVIRKAREGMVNKVWKSLGKKPEVAAAAMLLKDAMYDAAGGPALRERIAKRELSYADLANYIGGQCDTGIFSPYRLPKLSKADLENLAAVAKGEGDPAWAARVRGDADRLRNLVYAGAADAQKLDLILGGFAQGMTDAVTDRIRGRAKALLTDDLIGKTVGELVDLSKLNLKENLGLDKALQSADLHPKIRSEIDRLLGQLEVDLMKAAGLVKTTVRKEIDQGHGEQMPNFADPARDSVASARESGQQAVKDINIRKVADSMKDMPDPVNGAITNVADQILSGRTYDAKAKDFLDDPKSTNWLDKIWTDFGLRAPRGTGV